MKKPKIGTKEYFDKTARKILEACNYDMMKYMGVIEKIGKFMNDYEQKEKQKKMEQEIEKKQLKFSFWKMHK